MITGDLMLCDSLSSSTNIVYFYSGLTGILTGSVSNNGPYHTAITNDSGGNIILVDSVGTIEDVRRMVGSSLDTLDTFTIINDSYGIAMNLSTNNLIRTDDVTNYIYEHSKVTNTILGSFAAPSDNVTGLAFDENNNLISCNYTNAYVFFHSGLSDVITGSILAPATTLISAGVDIYNNLVTLNNSKDYVFTHEGLSTILTGSFAAPKTNSTAINVFKLSYTTITTPKDILFLGGDGLNWIVC